VVAHVQLAQPALERGARLAVVVQRVVQHVVDEVAGEEAGRDRPGHRRAEDQHEREHEQRRQWDRHGRRHDQSQRIVGMVVVDAVHHPVQPRADAVLRLEMEDAAVDPVLAEGPEEVAAGDLDQRRPDRRLRQRQDHEHRHRRSEDQRRHRRMDARELVEPRPAEHRRRGAQPLGARGELRVVVERDVVHRAQQSV